MKNDRGRFGTVLLVGLGALGVRYLEGLSRLDCPVSVDLLDVNDEALSKALEVWGELSPVSANLGRIVHKIDEIGCSYDICIVATTSRGRRDLIKQLRTKSEIKYWVLEKVLEQSISAIDEISIILKSECCWVNTPRRVMPHFEQLKRSLLHADISEINVVGYKWGIACNSIHYVDLVSWLLGKSLVRVITDGLLAWRPAKREGFFDVDGELICVFEGGVKLCLQSVSEKQCQMIELSSKSGLTWSLNETTGAFRCGDTSLQNSKLLFQSEITAPIVKSILLTGRCGLPSLEESVHSHKILINSLLENYNSERQRSANLLNIT